jgi:23S rRNA pseudouridine1911/1915/1917 synthase
MNIPIIYEDEDLLVVDKPAFITVNKSETTANQETVQEWAEVKLDFKNIENISDEESEFYNRGGIVHRLDKETSGILLIAKNPGAFKNLQMQFKERSVEKSYLSLAHGKIVPPEGEINVPVGRLPWNRKQFGIIPGGRESKTLYKVVQIYQDVKSRELLSYIELYPQSGRTHQIRVHLKYIGHPVFSDFLYGGRKISKKDRLVLPRVFLHAAKITITHPNTNNVVTFQSTLPKELLEFINILQKAE